MCILATSKFHISRVAKVAQRCVRAFFMPYMRYNIGAQPRTIVIMAIVSPRKWTLTTGSGRRLFCLQVKNNFHYDKF